MYVTDVSTKDLVIDMSLDEANVQQKMGSMRDDGLGQPIVVRLEDMRIIDGLHRVEAAKRLGWQTITCVVQDCDKETFWNWRIQSARQHATITRGRLIEWIVECWKATPFYRQASLDDDSQTTLLDAANVLWNIHTESYKAASLDDTCNYGGYWDVLPPHLMEVFGWFRDRGKLWNMDPGEIMSVVFGYFGLVGCSAEHLGRIGAKHGLSFEDAMSIGSQVWAIGNDPGKLKPEIVESYLVNRAPGQTLKEFLAQKEKDERRIEIDVARSANAAQMERERIESVRSLADKSDPERIRNEILYKADLLDSYIEKNSDTLRSMPDGPDLLLGIAEWAVNTANALYPGLNAQMPRIVSKAPSVPLDVMALSESQLLERTP